MPLAIPIPRGRLRYALLALLLVVAGALYGLRHLGVFLAAEDPLENADAIFVLAGTTVERPLEAADLFLAGYAPRILITRPTEEQASGAAERRGVRVPSQVDVATSVLRGVGVPEPALVVPARIHDNTAAEAATLREQALHYGWRTIIVVSSKYHLRRVAVACGRALRGTGVRIILRGSRYDPSTPERWWQRRADIRWVFSEVPKLTAYAVGLGE